MTADRLKSSDFRREFARVIHGVHARPVEVLHHGEPTAVVISVRDFEELKYLRSLYQSHKRK